MITIFAKWLGFREAVVTDKTELRRLILNPPIKESSQLYMGDLVLRQEVSDDCPHDGSEMSICLGRNCEALIIYSGLIETGAIVDMIVPLNAKGLDTSSLVEVYDSGGQPRLVQDCHFIPRNEALTFVFAFFDNSVLDRFGKTWIPLEF